MGGVSREAELSMAALSMFPGFRFSPKDEELILFYLKNKLHGSDDSVDVISEIDICKFEPWDLPGKSRIPSENEWFFFSPRGRKYPNGTQNKRATEMGYWKATGKERNVKSGGSEIIGTKRTLVFHLGRAPTGERTEWIMHEYCFNPKSQDSNSNSNSMVVCRLRKNNDFRRNNSDKASSSKRQVSADDDGEKVGGESDRLSKNCSSSFDSHSLEQFDSVSAIESNSNLDPPLHQPLAPQQGNVGDEELYADLLKDDIITLDDSLVCATQNSTPIIMNFSESEKCTHSPTQTVVPKVEAPSCQGSATRSIHILLLLIIFVASLHIVWW